jgi:hypothetical protein
MYFLVLEEMLRERGRPFLQAKGDRAATGLPRLVITAAHAGGVPPIHYLQAFRLEPSHRHRPLQGFFPALPHSNGHER